VSFDPNSPPPWQQPQYRPAPESPVTSAYPKEPAESSPAAGALLPLPFSAGELLAWLAIFGLTGLLFISNVFLRPELAERDWEQPVTEVTNAEILGKMLYFSQELAPQFQQQGNLEDMLGQLDSGPLEQRYCQALALNEFDGPEAGLHQLERIDELVEREGYQPNERQQKLRGVVQKLLEARLENGALAEDALTAEEKEYLTKQLRWFGRLALNPEELPGAGRAEVRNQAAKGTVVLFSAMGIGLTFILAGCFGLLVFLMMLVLGRLQSWMPDRVGRGPIYAETFAIWLVGFFMAQFALGALLQQFPLGLHFQMAALPTIFFVSLLALAWPVFRGVSFAQVREDIGWTTPRPISDVFAGLAGYASCTPLMGLALLATLVVAGLIMADRGEHELAGSSAPIHPIIGYIASGDWIVIGLIYLATCVAAPIVEETMFRGVLFRSLRDRSAGLGRFASVAISALLNSLVFAAIHPQGAFGIPVLTTLAIGFSLVRQWRDSLIAPIFMHALNNFMVTTFAVLLMA
jgi:membrane protease YdiL (CAAX protease family)